MDVYICGKVSQCDGIKLAGIRREKRKGIGRVVVSVRTHNRPTFSINLVSFSFSANFIFIFGGRPTSFCAFYIF